MNNTKANMRKKIVFLNLRTKLTYEIRLPVNLFIVLRTGGPLSIGFRHFLNMQVCQGHRRLPYRGNICIFCDLPAINWQTVWNDAFPFVLTLVVELVGFQ